MKKILFFKVFVFIIVSHAQENQIDIANFQDQTIHSSPTTASLGSYGASPVSLATGTPNINIPIWDLSGNSISTSIYLSYRPGIKVDQLSEYTGIGWSLNGGGVITREIFGAPDGENIIGRINYNPDAENPLPYHHAEDYYLLDGGSDIYNYNFPGHSGQFALNDDLSIYYLEEHQNWKFSFSEDEITIIDKNGTKYIFDEKEYSTNPYDDEEGNSMGPQPVVAWHLSSITSATLNERIEFTYYDEVVIDDVPRQKQLLLKVQNAPNFSPNESHVRNITFHDGVTYQSKKLNDITLYKKNVPVSKVVFEANTPRIDVGGTSRALSRISIYDNPLSLQPLKYFDFDIEHVGNERLFLRSIQEFSGNGNEFKPPYEFGYKNENNLPTRFSFKSDYWGYYSKYGAEYPSHPSFKWYGDPKKTKVPSFPEAQYGSLATIKYPTGAQNNFSYELNGYYERIINNDLVGLQLDWAATQWRNKNNQPSDEETIQFVLDESKQISIDATLHYKVDLTTTGTGTVASEAREHEISIVNVNNPNTPVFLLSFDGEGDPDAVDLVLWGGNPNLTYLPATYYYNGAQSIEVGGRVYQDVKITLPAGTYQAKVKAPSSTNSDNLFGKISVDIKYPIGFIDAEIPVKGIRIAAQELMDSGGTIRYIDYQYKIHDENSNATNKSSGEMPDELILRAEAINSKVTYYTLYETLNSWHRPGVPSLDRTLRDPFVSSNMGFCYLEKFGNQGSEYLADVCMQTQIFKREAVFYRNSKFASHTEIGYKEVRVEEEGNGFTLHKFNPLDHTKGYDLRGYYVARATYKYDQNGNIVLDTNREGNYRGAGGDGLTNRNAYAWPYTGNSITSTLWKKPQQTRTYKYDSNTPVLLKEENYSYEIIDQPKLYQVDIRFYGGIFYPHFVADISNDVYRIVNKSTKDFDQESGEYLYTTNIYHYSFDYNLPDEIRTTNSKGKFLLKKIKYPFQFDDGAFFSGGSSIEVYDLMRDNLLVPIEEQLWESNGNTPKLLSGKLNIYDKVSAASSTNTLYQPIEVLSLETGSLTNNQNALSDQYFEPYYGDGDVDWTNEVSGYDYGENGVEIDYDINGNTIEVREKNGSSTSYIWGYNEQYPIAKIENFGNSQITSAIQNIINSAVLASENDDDTCTDNGNCDEKNLRTALRNLRNHGSLSNAMITTYTYNPSVGMTSMTDPRGYTTYYQYDGLNRLKTIKDADGLILSENQYHYKGQ